MHLWYWVPSVISAVSHPSVYTLAICSFTATVVMAASVTPRITYISCSDTALLVKYNQAYRDYPCISCSWRVEGRINVDIYRYFTPRTWRKLSEGEVGGV